MSSSEPRPTDGEGLAEVHVVTAAPAKPASTMVTPAPPSVASSSLGVPTLQSPRERSPEEELLPPLLTAGDLVTEAPPWLFSAALHMIAVIVLGLILVVPEVSNELLLRFDTRDNMEDDMTGTDFDMPLDLNAEVVADALSPQQIPEFEEPLSAQSVVTPKSPVAQEIDTNNTQIRMALSGREKGMQQALLDAYGGTSSTQHSVEEALRWLARYQTSSGLWSMTGKYTNGASAENREAATAMALLAFQGAGFTPLGDQHEPFTRVTSRAWHSLLESQDDSGIFFKSGPSHGQLYTHAIATIAICELYGMTGDTQYREPAQRAIDYCVRVQAPAGGWRYFPGKESDLSVTGWFVMALQSARMAGLTVPSLTFTYVRDYLSTVSRKSGSRYVYQPGKATTRSMTAEGLLCRQYLGWKHSDYRLQDGADFLIEHLPTWKDGKRNAYYWYYATQVCHHMEGRHWRIWNSAMREVLPLNQVSDGRERGSWDPRGDEWGREGGRLFITCLSTYMLEVYYRHLPIYQTDLLNGGF